jgi:hypothetical protein
VLGSLARRRVHAVPYTPARRFAKGKGDPAFRTKLAIGADLAVRAREAGFAFRVVVADSAYGDQDGFRAELAEAGSVRDGTQAAPRDLGLRPGRAHSGGRGPRAGRARARRPGRLAPLMAARPCRRPGLRRSCPSCLPVPPRGLRGR